MTVLWERSWSNRSIVKTKSFAATDHLIECHHPAFHILAEGVSKKRSLTRTPNKSSNRRAGLGLGMEGYKNHNYYRRDFAI